MEVGSEVNAPDHMAANDGAHLARIGLRFHNIHPADCGLAAQTDRLFVAIYQGQLSLGIL